ncbi:ATP-dependent DNA helicase [Variovorax sp. RT4R15]|uniref:ATP-dependent DNA helicase n=1 Tax=Variovorax sp. RT4R15 TaxID=3443737 RepID=UPI003F48CD43
MHTALVPSAGPFVAAMTVSVRTLCAFAAKAGDLDIRFVPAPSALEGMAGHRLVQARRGPGYQKEVALTSRCDSLQVRGRADGFDADRGRVEEIKTFRGDFEAMRSNHRALHWAQARCYGWMLCEQESLASITVALVYLEIATGEETVLEARCTREALRADFEALCAKFMGWARQEETRRAALIAQLDTLAFPHAGFRAGQRELAQGVYRAASAQRCLIAQAPTGIGKTVATLYPLLRGWSTHKTDKIFYLTAKTPGRAVALQALDLIGAGSGALRVLELTARDKACEYPGRACSGESCPLARGFYDRLAAARETAATARRLDRARLREIALAHSVCPYYLAQEMVRWSDVVVADYNYYFDSSALLYALAQQEEWRVAVLVDEAHNLLERARGMYSATLNEGLLAGAQRAAPGPIKRILAAVQREWQGVQNSQQCAYEAREAIPERFHRSLEAAVSTIAEHLAVVPPPTEGSLLRIFFDMLHFARMAESFGLHSVFESALGSEGEGTLSLRNLVPAPFLKSRFAASITTVCFSATIAPFGFYRDVLGLPDGSAELDVVSPFRADQLHVRVALDLSTRFGDRARSLHALTALIGSQFRKQPGNYLAFFSSFAYLEQAHTLFRRHHPDVATWAQSSGMPEADRETFAARFVAGGQGIGFAVLGGAFGEGLDLPGDRLIGAFIASLGLPEHDAMNEVMCARMEVLFGAGYDYTYLFPGLRKVVQAAGRVIRTEHDAGVVHLMDDRFARPEIRRLLPAWWRVETGGAGRGARSPGSPPRDLQQ